MQTIVAGLMAITAMGASILADVDPVTTVVRGLAAFVVGMLLTGVWTSVVNPTAGKKKEKTEPETDSNEVESEASDDSEPQEEAA